MWRALVFIGLLGLAGFAAVWLADRPGSVVVTWSGVQAQTTVAFAAVMTIVLAMVLAAIWAIVRSLLALPSRMSARSGARRKSRGYEAVSRGIVAVGSGDPVAARRHAGEAERLLGREPLTLLLRAQAAQISGDRPGAEAAFRHMVEDSETRVLGLRGLFVEAQRRGDQATARAYAAEAARLAPAVSWANEAVLETQCAEGNWRGALEIVERRASLGLLDKSAARRDRAVLLTADALEHEAGDPDRSLTSAAEAARLAPDLVPAAALAGRLLARRGDLRRAAKVIETAWKITPHPDLAEAYLGLRMGDSALDRLQRAETLARLSSWAPESRFALAGAALDARDFARARDVLRPVLDEGLTVRACLLMAEIEEAEHGREFGRVREWLARAARARRDPAWIADGIVSDRWAPVSPVTGKLDAFQWQAPPDLLSGPGSSLDDFAADGDSAKPAIEGPAAATADDRPLDETATPELRRDAGVLVAPPAEPGEAAEPGSTRSVEKPGDKPPEALGPVTPAPLATVDPRATEPGGAAPLPKPTPVIFPVAHAPDDPGPQGESEPPRQRKFG